MWFPSVNVPKGSTAHLDLGSTLLRAAPGTILDVIWARSAPEARTGAFRPSIVHHGRKSQKPNACILVYCFAPTARSCRHCRLSAAFLCSPSYKFLTTSLNGGFAGLNVVVGWSHVSVCKDACTDFVAHSLDWTAGPFARLRACLLLLVDSEKVRGRGQEMCYS